MTLSNYNWLSQRQDLGLSYTLVPPSEVRDSVFDTLGGLKPIDSNDYEFDLPPDIGPEGFVYQPPLIKDLIVIPPKDLAIIPTFTQDIKVWEEQKPYWHYFPAPQSPILHPPTPILINLLALVIYNTTDME